ncbi:hypothetical protein GF322_00345 [Candidatus Dependentiae bacterium]|nr:hypothetical protein [Candidatus Dependentiae bacterium]
MKKEGALIVIVDGYNLLRAVFYKVKGKLTEQRNHFIKQLGHYKSKKNEINEIIIVFDGGYFRHATREIHNGVVTIFAGQKSSADDWIINYIKKNKQYQILLVSRDRQLISKCENYGADAIDVEEFYELVQSSILEDVSSKQKINDLVKKYEKNIYVDDKLNSNDKILDLLMEETQIDSFLEEKERYEKNDVKNNKKKGKLPKKEKKIYKKIKKL